MLKYMSFASLPVPLQTLHDKVGVSLGADPSLFGSWLSSVGFPIGSGAVRC